MLPSGFLDKLPQELRDACFETLYHFLPKSDRQGALRTCLLVCRDWSHQARTHLFRTISFDNDQISKSSTRGLTAIAHLRQVLDDGHVSDPFPRLCSYIKSFHVKVTLSHSRWIQVEDDLAAIMSMLSHSKSGLSELEVEINGLEWKQLSKEFRTSLQTLCHSSHLKSLKIIGLTQVPVSLFYGISLDYLWVDFRDTVAPLLINSEEEVCSERWLHSKTSPLLVIDFSGRTASYPSKWDHSKQPQNIVDIRKISIAMYLVDFEPICDLLAHASKSLEHLDITRFSATHWKDWNTREHIVQKFDLRTLWQLNSLRVHLNISCFEPTETGKFGGMVSLLESCDLPATFETLYVDITLHNCWWHQHENRLFMGEDEKWYILADVLALPHFQTASRIILDFHVVFQFKSAMFRGNSDATSTQIRNLLEMWFADVAEDRRFKFDVRVTALDKNR